MNALPKKIHEARLISRLIQPSTLVVSVLLLTNIQADDFASRVVSDSSGVGTKIETFSTGTGTDFRISEGLKNGGNLFHSFSDFEISLKDRATFVTLPEIRNILARVTGSNPSRIFGTIDSEGEGQADLYLINPNGIIFGGNAKLELSGAFHATTADYVRLGQNERFSARLSENSTFSHAPPEAFGFLDKNIPPAKIAITGGSLEVKDGQNLSLIGGDLEITGTQPPAREDEDGNVVYSLKVILRAPSGRINLISVASQGEVELKSDSVVTPGRLGKIAISIFDDESSDSSEIGTGDEGQLWVNIDVSGIKPLEKEAGQIFIRAGQFTAKNTWIFADNYGDRNGLIDILTLGETNLTDNTRITSENFGKSQGGGITITQSCQDCSLQFLGSDLDTTNHNSGGGGDIHITTPNLQVGNSSQLETTTYGTGNSGNIEINAQQVGLKGGRIGAYTTTGVKSADSGKAGDISIRGMDGKVTDKISLSDHSAISTSTEGEGGNAGKIELKTQLLFLTDRSAISSFSRGEGEGGLIKINAGTLKITQDKAEGESVISTESMEGGTKSMEGGNAGSIDITADSVNIRGPALQVSDENLQPYVTGIVTKAEKARGGNITLHVSDQLYLFNSKITAESRGNREGDNGGNLTINAPPFNKLKGFTLDNSQLLANANRGHGGNIDLYADNLTVNGNSRIDVSSRGGFNGNLFINSFGLTEAVILPGRQRPEEKPLLPSRCASFSKGSMSRFIITSRDILPRSPEDLRTHTIRGGK